MNVLIKREVGEVRELRRLKREERGRQEEKQRETGWGGRWPGRREQKRAEGRQGSEVQSAEAAQLARKYWQPFALQETGGWCRLGLLTLQGPTVGLRHLRGREKR